MTPDRNLRAFAWLPAERWCADQLIEILPVSRNSTKYMCKVCDKQIPSKDREKHATIHRREFKEARKRWKREEAQERRAESGPQVLTCENCGKTWERQPQKGRRPKLCEECR